jgi:hypothetical protein
LGDRLLIPLQIGTLLVTAHHRLGLLVVTDATGKWKHLIGWMTYAYGFTTDPFTWGENEPVTVMDYRVFMPPLPAKWGKLGEW